METKCERFIILLKLRLEFKGNLKTHHIINWLIHNVSTFLLAFEKNANETDSKYGKKLTFVVKLNKVEYIFK